MYQYRIPNRILFKWSVKVLKLALLKPKHSTSIITKVSKKRLHSHPQSHDCIRSIPKSDIGLPILGREKRRRDECKT
jgi:hypothetical protein